MNEIIVLGSGTSTGIPLVGCHCEVCQSSNPKNTRLRTSLFLKLNGIKILIDTTPDLRAQPLNHKIEDVDGVIITHDHADHLHGIDDIRPLTFNMQSPMPFYTDQLTAQAIENRFDYIFDDTRPNIGGGKPKVELKHLIIPDGQLSTHEVQGKQFHFFQLPHGYGKSLGFQIDGMAYLIDCHEIPKNILIYLKNQKLDLLIIDCCQKLGHKTHLTQDKAFGYISEIAPKSAGLIHMNHSLEHNKLAKDAAQHFSYPVFPLYDGQIVTFPCNS